MNLFSDAPVDHRYAADRIVVDLDDQVFVERSLDRLRVERSSAVDVIGAFRIARIAIAAVTDEQADGLPGGADARAQIEDHNTAQGLHLHVTAMDVLLRLIRNHAAPRELKMGKDRDIDQLEALPHSGGGEGPPRPGQATVFGSLPPASPTGGVGIRVGVLDSALYPNAELDKRYELSDMLTSDPPRRAWTGHATFIAGRILRRAPDASLVVRQVLDENGTASGWDVAVTMADFLRRGVPILNMSLGGWTPDNQEPFLMRTAVAELIRNKIVLVASAGNHGNGPAVAAQPDGKGGFTPLVLTDDRRAKTWPAALPGVIAVGAATVRTGADGRTTLSPTDFTPRDVDWISAWAPGSGVTSTFLDGDVDAVVPTVSGHDIALTHTDLGAFGGYAIWGGTSMAAGEVTGEIARLAADHNGDMAAAWADIRKRPVIAIADGSDVRPSGRGNSDWAK